MVAASVSMFACKSVGATRVLIANTAINCDSDTHKYYQMIGYIGIGVWAAGLPALILYLLHRQRETFLYVPSLYKIDRRKVGDRADLEMNIGYLARGYKPTAYYWISVKLLSKLLLSVSVVLFPGQVQLQVIAALTVSIFFCYLHIDVQPIGDPILNRVEQSALPGEATQHQRQHCQCVK